VIYHIHLWSFISQKLNQPITIIIEVSSNNKPARPHLAKGNAAAIFREHL
jgi:hypothetical protein